jgi:hypothetical protein
MLTVQFFFVEGKFSIGICFNDSSGSLIQAHTMVFPFIALAHTMVFTYLFTQVLEQIKIEMWWLFT